MTASGTGPVAPPRTRSGRWSLTQLFFNGAGRLGRTAFVLALLGVAIVWRLWRATPGRGLHLVLGPVVGLLLIAAACTVISKRLHDLGWAGWWSAAPVGLLMLVVGGEAPSSPAQVTAAALAGGALLWLAAWPGARGFNRFGPSPKT